MIRLCLTFGGLVGSGVGVVVVVVVVAGGVGEAARGETLGRVGLGSLGADVSKNKP
jgi:hypothetical protein